MRRSLRLLAAVGVMAWALPASAAPEVYPVDKLQRGQTCYGYTTFAGGKPERFTCEIVSVAKNYMPKMDLIFVKSDDPKFATTGFWAGMSGSPLYIDDKVVCAFSYNFRFNKVPLGGCTPLGTMKKESDAYRRAKTVAGKDGTRVLAPVAASMADWKRLTPNMDVQAALDALGPPRSNWLTAAPLPGSVTRPTTPYNDEVPTAMIPLNVGGFTNPAFAQLSQILGNSTLVPVQAGGGAAASNISETPPSAFVPGGSIAVEVYRGDLNAAGVGTVSYVDGDKVLAFGHPMFQSGETYAPVSTAYVHTVIPSAMNSFVIGSAVKEIGSLVQDRQSMIMADLKMRSPMIPVDVAIKTTAGKHVETGSFHLDVMNNKFLTASLVGAALGNAVQHYLPDQDHVTARVDSAVYMKGEKKPIEFVDYMYANDGFGSVVGGVRGLRVIIPLLLNPFAPVEIERVTFNVELEFDNDAAEIKELMVPVGELVPGQRNMVEVRMTRYDGGDVIEKVPVDVPASLAGTIVQIEVTAGDRARLDSAPPVDLATLIAAFRSLLPGNVWAATLYPADEGVAMDGKLVKDLPASAQDKLRPQTRTQRAQAYKPMARTLSPAARVVDGSATMLVRVGTL